MEIYLTIEGLAEYLKLAEQTIRRWVLNREIPFHKIKKVIRFHVSEIEKWIDDGGICKTKSFSVSAESKIPNSDLFNDELKSVENTQEIDGV